MTKIEAEVITSLAANSLNVAKAARQLKCHTNTVIYHMKKIKEGTGVDLKQFEGICKLLPVAEEILHGELLETIDLEVVTRCRDCKYWLEDFGEVCSREEDWFYCAPDDFCSRAGRREEPSCESKIH